jgi:hypothetical protein
VFWVRCCERELPIVIAVSILLSGIAKQRQWPPPASVIAEALVNCEEASQPYAAGLRIEEDDGN